ncbi:MAG: GGDEF domain-containing protein [Pseudomonadota bacterium]
MEREQSPFAEARVLASRVLDLAQRYRVPPFPRAYEVWFTYVSGTNDALRARIDAALEEGEVPLQLIDQLHQQYLAPESINAGMERIGSRMGEELAEIIDLVEDGAAHGEALAYKIEQADRAMEKASDANAKQRLLGELRRDSQQHVRALGRLGGGLETVRTQMLSMQRELRELRQSVLLDQLTQLPNRRFFDDALPRIAAEAERAGQPFSLVLFEIDNYDEFVSRFGRKPTEHVLTRCAALLRGKQRDGDVALRLDTERFGLLLRNLDVTGAHEVLNTLRRELSELKLINTQTRQPLAAVVAALGCATHTKAERPGALLARAADALEQDRRMRIADQPPAA